MKYSFMKRNEFDEHVANLRAFSNVMSPLKRQIDLPLTSDCPNFSGTHGKLLTTIESITR